MAAATTISLWLAEASGDGSATAAAAAAPASQNSGGVWNGFVHLIETTISAISDALSAIGLPYSYGFAIIAFTILVKAITFPLNLKQMRSTLSMQALAPKLRELQARYRDNPQVMNMETARLYQEAKLNPLAGCLPVLVQLPVWIALYRALLNLAQENRLTSGFFFLPSLQGPVQQGGSLSAWLFPFKDGAPPVGWHDAIAYLVLPCLLVVTQIVSQRLLQPPQQDAQTKQANVILRFLPFMVGWFSLNVPSGLSLYWVTNNVVSTLQTIGIKRYLAKQQPELLGATGGGDAGNAAAGGNGRMADGAADGAATREPPVGFGALVSANKDGKGGGAAVTESRGSSSSSEEDGAEAKKGKRRPSKKKKR
ncbi:hypothetical protein CDCA_CDCA12G3499 [Cyanidium caldarium]|uniref:Membrane insertase YidC/Oxa/ALB C-terminal domain-containing protein n=1 Tax=Cyanidium caldarium TaxID=2771 RepID=A0AAV9IYV0_CYACA|nr:hypothetical protein CDCA_CDCA12G3499 [Cyanidium caldarium]